MVRSGRAKFDMSDLGWKGSSPRCDHAWATKIFRDFLGGPHLDRVRNPFPIEGRTYAVTAWHVIEVFREAAAEDGVDVEGYFLPAKPGVGIGPPFVRAPQPWTAPRPDVALRPIDPEVPARIGKKAFELTAAPVPTFPVPYALAAGYPTMSKAVHPEPQGERLAMQCVHAVAEGGSWPEGELGRRASRHRFAQRAQWRSRILERR
jgi:hypothetical protein